MQGAPRTRLFFLTFLVGILLAFGALTSVVAYVASEQFVAHESLDLPAPLWLAH